MYEKITYLTSQMLNQLMVKFNMFCTAPNKGTAIDGFGLPLNGFSLTEKSKIQELFKAIKVILQHFQGRFHCQPSIFVHVYFSSIRKP